MSVEDEQEGGEGGGRGWGEGLPADARAEKGDKVAR